MIENNLAMEQRRPPEYIIEVFADPSSVKDVVRGIHAASSRDMSAS
jgi:autophagy-related protein 101